MQLFVGLGNPEPKHLRNRHNIGFMVLDTMAAYYGMPGWSRKFQGLVTQGRIGGDKVMLLKPQGYMNHSGQAVGEAARFFKLRPEQLLVFHDELELPLGRVKAKKGGGHAGHNGLKDIDRHLGTPDYWRVRMGIDKPEASRGRQAISRHVLSDFAKAEEERLIDLLAAAAEEAPLLVEGRMDAFMSRLAHRLQPARPPAPAGRDSRG